NVFTRGNQVLPHEGERPLLLRRQIPRQLDLELRIILATRSLCRLESEDQFTARRRLPELQKPELLARPRLKRRARNLDERREVGARLHHEHHASLVACLAARLALASRLREGALL